jgi:hypothetical protein
MPKLLLFAPCEKVIIDQHNNPTLISLLSEWNAGTRDLPEKAVAAKQWDVFALWQRTDGDGDKEFVQVCELITSSGIKAIAAEISFRMTAPTHRNTITIMGLPINPGRYELSLYISERGAEKARELCAVYPLFVTEPST